MNFLLQPWHVLLAILAGWVNRQQQQAIEYLRTENQVLKERLGKQRILLNDDQRAALAQAIERGPTPYLDGIVRWRLCDLAQWLWEAFRVSASEQTLSREVRAMGYRKLSARPRHHAQDSGAVEAFKKTSPPQWQRLPPAPPGAK